jgi:serine/threonine protein kinase
MGGGDLLNLLIERDVFEEDFTRFYVAEVGSFLILQWQSFLMATGVKMILAIESCHKHGFIHRDIKPDVSPTLDIIVADPVSSFVELPL